MTAGRRRHRHGVGQRRPARQRPRHRPARRAPHRDRRRGPHRSVQHRRHVAAVRDVLVEAGNAIHQWDAGTVNAGQTITFRGDAIGIDDRPAPRSSSRARSAQSSSRSTATRTPTSSPTRRGRSSGTPRSGAGTAPTASSSTSSRPSTSRSKLHGGTTGPEALVTGNEAGPRPQHGRRRRPGRARTT